MTAPFGAGHSDAVQPQATPGNDLSTIFQVIGRASTVTAVTYTPNATITGAATNNRTVNLVNLGQGGVGTVVVATLNFANLINAPVGVPKAIPLSGTPANLVLAPNDVLQWQSVHIGTGIADPGGLVTVAASPNYA